MFKAVLVAGLAALVAAQSANLGFDSVPAPAQAGKAETITYHAASMNAPVTITLRKGDSNDLQTISTLTSSATGGSYQWTPDSSLTNADNYALQITQGSDINYYGPFAISGGSASSSSASSASSMSAMTSVPAGNSSSWITTTSCPPSGNATVPATVPASMGTGSSMVRNTTLVTPTLSSAMSASATGGSGSTNTNGAGFQGSATGSSAPKNSNSAATMTTGSSVAALVLSGVAALFFA